MNGPMRFADEIVNRKDPAGSWYVSQVSVFRCLADRDESSLDALRAAFGEVPGFRALEVELSAIERTDEKPQ